MAVEIDVRPVKAGDIEEIVVNLRQADREELLALGCPEDFWGPVLAASVARSNTSKVIAVNGRPICLFGAVDESTLLAAGAVVWAVGTDGVAAHRRVLMRACRPYIESLVNQYERLFNRVSADNHQAVAWLKRVGFSLQPAELFGPLNKPFHYFELTR